MGNIIIAAIVVVLLIIGLQHYRKTLKSGCCGEHDEIKKISTKDKDKSLYPYSAILNIDDMFCKNCATKIENAFNEHKEYLASVNLGKKEITILSMNEPDIDAYKQIIIKLGYTPR